jgi:hypothetical protein
MIGVTYLAPSIEHARTNCISGGGVERTPCRKWAIDGAVLLAGCYLGLTLIRALAYGQLFNIWVFVDNLLIAAMSVYLFSRWRRNDPIESSQNKRLGRLSAGVFMLFVAANDFFELLPGQSAGTVQRGRSGRNKGRPYSYSDNRYLPADFRSSGTL